MKCVILAAGMAMRLRPLTTETPKCLLKVGGRSLLERSMDALIDCGCRDFVIVTGFKREKIEAFIRTRYGSTVNVAFIHNELYETTNNIYSLWLAIDGVGEEPILLLDSDLLYDSGIVKEMLDCREENALALIRHDLSEEEMKVVVDEAMRITEINKTCDPKSAAGESLGIEKMGKPYVTALHAELGDMMQEESLRNVFYEKAFERLIAKGHSFTIKDVTNFRSMELDTVDDFKTAEKLFSE